MRKQGGKFITQDKKYFHLRSAWMSLWTTQLFWKDSLISVQKYELQEAFSSNSAKTATLEIRKKELVID
jgi:hypothetical protein